MIVVVDERNENAYRANKWKRNLVRRKPLQELWKELQREVFIVTYYIQVKRINQLAVKTGREAKTAKLTPVSRHSFFKNRLRNSEY